MGLETQTTADGKEAAASVVVSGQPTSGVVAVAAALAMVSLAVSLDIRLVCEVGLVALCEAVTAAAAENFVPEEKARVFWGASQERWYQSLAVVELIGARGCWQTATEQGWWCSQHCLNRGCLPGRLRWLGSWGPRWPLPLPPLAWA